MTQGWRRREFLGVVAGAMAFAVAGCGDDDTGSSADTTGPATTTTGPATAAASTSAATAAAATSAAATGSEPPSRVVAIGQGADADTLLALGIVPVGMTASTTSAGGITPWAEQALGGAEVTLLDQRDGVPFEQVTALDPDLIVATTSYSFSDDRSKLEQIATAVGPETTADQETWQQTTRQVGAAVGEAVRADELVDSTEGAIAALAADHPEWAGTTFAFGPVISLDQIYAVNATDDVAAVLLQQLGMVLSPTIAAQPDSDTPGRAVVSREQLGLLDADVVILVFFDDEVRAQLEADPLFQAVPAVARGAYVDLDADTAVAMAFPSVLSIPFALERLGAALATAIPGEQPGS